MRLRRRYNKLSNTLAYEIREDHSWRGFEQLFKSWKGFSYT
jgi:hypothetical protein